jgi:hypothetical protein
LARFFTVFGGAVGYALRAILGGTITDWLMVQSTILLVSLLPFLAGVVVVYRLMKI